MENSHLRYDMLETLFFLAVAYERTLSHLPRDSGHYTEFDGRKWSRKLEKVWHGGRLIRALDL